MGFIKRSGVLQLLVDVDVVNRRAARQPLCQLRGLGEVVGFDLEALNVAVKRGHLNEKGIERVRAATFKSAGASRVGGRTKE